MGIDLCVLPLWRQYDIHILHAGIDGYDIIPLRKISQLMDHLLGYVLQGVCEYIKKDKDSLSHIHSTVSGRYWITGYEVINNA